MLKATVQGVGSVSSSVRRMSIKLEPFDDVLASIKKNEGRIPFWRMR